MNEKFPNPLILRDCGYPPTTWWGPFAIIQRHFRRRRWKLERGFIFASEVAGRLIYVREDFICDLASIPRIPLVFLLLGDRAIRAGLVHDWLYYTGQLSKTQSDLVFYEVLRAEGYLRITSAIATAGVLIGGWIAWWGHRRRD